MTRRLWVLLGAGVIAGCQAIAGINDDLPGTPEGPSGGTAGSAGSNTSPAATGGSTGTGGRGGGSPDASAGASGSGGSNTGSGGSAGTADASAGGNGGASSAGGNAGASGASGNAGMSGAGGNGGAGGSAGSGGTAGRGGAGGTSGSAGTAGASGGGGNAGSSGGGPVGGAAGATVDAGPTCTDMRQNGDESDVDCGGSCNAKCATGKRCNGPTDCQGGFCNANKCGVCSTGAKGCSGNAPETCTVDGLWNVAAACASPTPMCSAGLCATPSCEGAGTGAGSNCGPAMDNCCDSPYVIGGDMFSRSFDGITYTDSSAGAKVSDFRMDRYEVTVGRFRAFLNAYPVSRPAAGAGAHPTLGAASGWQSSWDSNLPSTVGMYQALLKCGGFATWTDSPGANEKKPMTCLSWYDAFAFCAWDGGRLPTEAEWNYVAAYGNGACPYPWSTCVPIDTTYANYDCTGDGSLGVSQGGTCTANDILAVGFRSPKGDARWSQADLAGNVNEWTLDTFAAYITPCNDCANLTNSSTKVYRGGNYIGGPNALLSGTRASTTATFRDPGNGVRCVRAP